MTMLWHPRALGAGLGLLALLTAALPAQTDQDDPARFATPKRLRAGEAWLGAKRSYPSPAVHDVDGDGTPDLIIGDLPGRVTFAPRVDGGYEGERPMKDRSGERLKFNNW